MRAAFLLRSSPAQRSLAWVAKASSFLVPGAAPALCGLLIPLAAVFAQAPDQPPAVFRSGTRLVQVEVTVRGRHVTPPGVGGFLRDLFDTGPPFGPPGPPLEGLTKDDFKLFDNDKPQPIAFVRGGPVVAAPPVSFPPGAVSNRIDSSGKPVNTATVILVDQLNTSPDLIAYERLGLSEMLRSLSAADNHVALYTMGRNLHVLTDFTSDPKKLLDLAAKVNQPHGAPELGAALKDYGGLLAWNVLDDGSVVPDALGFAARAEMTVNAMRVVIQHLARVSGRKNLVLLTAQDRLPPQVMGMILQANIVLYPVMVRAVGCGFCSNDELDRENAFSTGGRAFFDARDLTFAVHTAEEDSSTTYLLGFYPPEEMLDGKYHRLAVKLRDKTLEVHYRNGYLATKSAPSPPRLSDQALLDGPLDSTGIGLTAQLEPEPAHPGMRQVELTVDLHDVHLQPEAGRVTGAFEVLLVNQATHDVYSGRIDVNLAPEQLATALEKGYRVVVGGIGSQPGEVRIAVRDPGTLAAGSLRLPVPAQ